MTLTRDIHGNDSKARSHSKNRKTNQVAIIALLGVMMIMAAAGPLSASTASAATSRIDVTQFQLDIVPIAPTLPADGGTYYAMIQLQTAKDSKPIVAPFDIDITVLSSDPSVLTGQEKVTLKEGDSLVKAELKSTSKAGQVSLSAQAEGIKSDSITINTLKLDSQEPTKLVLYSAPASFVPDPAYPGLLYVQILNSQNMPAASKNSVTITLASSKPEVGNVPSYVTIGALQTGAMFSFVPKNEIGTTKISASSPGLAPAQIDVKTDGPAPTKLIVEFGPPTIAGASGFTSQMTVQLQDDGKLPIKAATPLTVTLKSSDPSIAEVPASVTINTGETYVLVPLKAKGGIGTATITASASGLESGISDLTSVDVSPASSSEGMNINMYSVPTILPPDNSEHSALIVQFTDAQGRPWNAPPSAYNRVVLSSSDAKVGTIEQGYVVQNGYAQVKFKTTFATGTTQITASSTGFNPAQMDLVISGSSPKALKLVQIPAIVQASNSELQALVVSFVDSTGKPVITPQDTTVFFSSSNIAVASVQASVIIPAGTSFATIRVQNTDKPGVTTITATASDLAAANLDYNTVGYVGSISQYALGLYTIPKISADGHDQEAVFVQMQDQTSNPVPAPSDVTVILTSSALNAGELQSQLVIPKGSSFAIAKFTPATITDDIKLKITASSGGFKSVDSDMQVTLQPLTVKITSTLPKQLSFGDTVPMEVEVKSGSIPVKGATIEFGGPQSNPTTATTDENGIAGGSYVSKLPGTNSIEITATKAGFKETTVKASISVAQTVNLAITAVTEGGVPISAQLKVQPPTGQAKDYNVQPGSPAKFANAKWGTYKITAPADFSNSMGQFKFVKWSDGSNDTSKSFVVITDQTISAVYHAKFLLTVTSPYGQTSGTGYYDEGTTAVISIDTVTVNGLIPKNFAGWTGDNNYRSGSPTTQVVVSGPMVIQAEWKDNYMMLAIIAAAVGGGGFITYKKVIKPRKEQAEKSRAPDLDWYKT